jgi:hypothetical protein
MSAVARADRRAARTRPRGMAGHLDAGEPDCRQQDVHGEGRPAPAGPNPRRRGFGPGNQDVRCGRPASPRRTPGAFCFAEGPTRSCARTAQDALRLPRRPAGGRLDAAAALGAPPGGGDGRPRPGRSPPAGSSNGSASGRASGRREATPPSPPPASRHGEGCVHGLGRGHEGGHRRVSERPVPGPAARHDGVVVQGRPGGPRRKAARRQATPSGAPGSAGAGTALCFVPAPPASASGSART